MKEYLENLIIDYVMEYQLNLNDANLWRTPLVKFKNSDDKKFEILKAIGVENHRLPNDIITDAKTVISYFIPYTKHVADSNIKKTTPSDIWSKNHNEANKMIKLLNQYFVDKLKELNINADYMKEPHDSSYNYGITGW